MRKSLNVCSLLFRYFPLVVQPAEPPRRDTMRIDDIEGTRARPRFSRPLRRDPNDVTDIAGACRRRRRSVSASSHTADRLLDVRDINLDGTWRTRRSTNPLQPVHTVHGRRVEDEAESHPKTRHRQRRSHEPFFPLTTSDIEGAQPAGVSKNSDFPGLPMENRRHFRQTNFVGDIEGSQAGTRRRGLCTQRTTNPNERDYALLDGNRRDDLVVPDTPLGLYAKQLRDPREEEIARLRAEVEALRRSQARPLRSASTAANARTNLETAQADEMKRKHDSALSSQSGLPASRHGTPSGSSAAEGGLFTDDGVSQRLVLRSSDGRPRVAPATPASSIGSGIRSASAMAPTGSTRLLHSETRSSVRSSHALRASATGALGRRTPLSSRATTPASLSSLQRPTTTHSVALQRRHHAREQERRLDDVASVRNLPDV